MDTLTGAMSFRTLETVAVETLALSATSTRFMARLHLPEPFGNARQGRLRAASRKKLHGKGMHEMVRYLIHDELSMKNVNCHVLLWSRRLPMHGYQAVTI